MLYRLYNVCVTMFWFAFIILYKARSGRIENDKSKAFNMRTECQQTTLNIQFTEQTSPVQLHIHSIPNIIPNTCTAN